jgi:hypothetical protein
MMVRRLTGSAKDCIGKHAPRPQIQFAQLQPIFGSFNGIRKEFNRREQDPAMDRRLIS